MKNDIVSSMTFPKISIMIPTYNQENYIKKSIESALNIEYPHLEVVVSDDCSTDNTYEIAKGFESDPRVKLYRSIKNVGRVKNYNYALNNLVTGEWILNCDGDDFLIPTDFFLKAMKVSEDDSDIVMFSANIYQLNSKTSERVEVKSYGDEGYIDGTTMFKNYFNYPHGLFHITSLYKREAAIRANFYTLDIISSDINSLLKILIGNKVYHFNDVIATWRHHETNETNSIDPYKRAKNLEMISDLYHYYLSNNSLSKRELDRWRKQAYRKRIVRTANRFLTRFHFKEFFTFIKEAGKQCPDIIIPILFDYRLVLTFLVPFRKVFNHRW